MAITPLASPIVLRKVARLRPPVRLPTEAQVAAIWARLSFRQKARVMREANYHSLLIGEHITNRYFEIQSARGAAFSKVATQK